MLKGWAFPSKDVLMKRGIAALATACVIIAIFALIFYSLSNELLYEHSKLVDNYNELVDNYNRLVDNYNGLLDNYNKLSGTAENLANESYLENRNINMSFVTSNGTRYTWTVPLDTLVSQTYLRWQREQTGDYTLLDLTDNRTGNTYHVVDYRSFIIENNFSEVIASLYHDLGNDDKAMVYEVWHIVTQLTVYSSEVGQTSRYPLDTFAGGGGDCKDLAVLEASMLKAVPANYVVELVYMDADHPTAPENVNHVAVWVVTPSGYKTFVEGTEHVEMNPYTEVDGWYFQVQ